MRLRETMIGPTGLVRFRLYRAGRLVDECEHRNLVVNGSKTALSRLIGGTVASNSITTFGVGTNAAAATVTDTALTNEFSKALDAVSFPASNSVQFNFSLASGDANGLAISEFGLFTAAGVLFSRIVRASPLNKAADISLAGTWTLTF